MWISMKRASVRLGKNLFRIRSEKDMSQDKVGRVLGLDKSYISNIEKGNKNPTLKTLEKLATALEVSLDELLG